MKERKKREKLEQQQREEVERQAKEEARRAKESRAAKKLAKKKKEEEEKMEFDKAMRLHMAVCIGGLREQMQEEMRKNMEEFHNIIKGKQQAASPASSASPVSCSRDWATSVLDEISQRAKELSIKEKRKRSPDKVIGNSPPMEMPPKRTPGKSCCKPVKLVADLQAVMTRKTTKKDKQGDESGRSPKRYTPKKGTPRTKIAAKVDSAGKTQFVMDNMRQLADFHVDDLKRLCRHEEIDYGNKVLAVINVAEKRAEEAYGGGNKEATTVEDTEEDQQTPSSQSTSEGKDERNQLESGSTMHVKYLRKWKPKSGPDKKTLVALLHNPRKIHQVSLANVDSMFRLYKAAKEFQQKSTRSYLRRLIGRTIKEKTGWVMGANLTVKVKYNDRVRLAEVRKFVNDKIEELKLPECLPYLRIEEHVSCRLQEVNGVHLMVCNANNVPKARHPDREKLLCREIEVAFGTWKNGGGEVVHVAMEEARSCMISRDIEEDNYLDIEVVKQTKTRFEGLVLTPLDRNQGETFVMCLLVYYEAMMSSFVTNPGYKVVLRREEEVKQEVHMKFKDEGLAKFASLGNARSRVNGLRLMDDVSLIVDMGGKRENEWVEEIWKGFETCYPDNLTLKRTDEGKGIWDFLGLEMRTYRGPPYVGSVQMWKNEKSVWEKECLEFKSG
ncbi:hypothetical protein CBR_g29299 [Chara braunii]|uniref:Uncharacterized protein n=1 Tax=Chara braunii TaxID=69332 RepID=A0A388LAC5_CHABU|nr:hypothetical protein CBR_g29299 [Chara braunii]|eukprot:GBG79248.1 hypothetical protein CBR_g29299 [Chara braunii]